MDDVLFYICCFVFLICIFNKVSITTCSSNRNHSQNTLSTNFKRILNVFSSGVPKVIHKVYIEHSMTIPTELPKPIQEAHNTWTKMNPKYTMKYYSGHDCEHYALKYFGERHLKAFRKLKPYSYKCDLIRFMILYNEGGVYTDWKTVCLTPLNKLIRENTKWISAWDTKPGRMLTGFFVTPPKNPILKTAIDMCLYNIDNNIYGSSPLEPTGPILLGKAFSTHYPQYEPHKIINEDGIQLGIFKVPIVRFNNIPYLQTKCDNCDQSQNWDKGNNYNTLWTNKDVYNLDM